MIVGDAWRDLRSLRHKPPGYAAKGARRATFQSSLEQCEQFIEAAQGAKYATRPVQLFYAMSQGSRASVAASPRIGNQEWRITGHGLSANTSPLDVREATVSAGNQGLFQAMAKVLGWQALAAHEPVTLGQIWPLLPETRVARLADAETLSALLLQPWPYDRQNLPMWSATVAWIPPHLRARYGDTAVGLEEHFYQYPALEGAEQIGPLYRSQPWREHDGGFLFEATWDLKFIGARTPADRTEDALLARYGDENILVATPRVGSMSRPLHPVLAWWSVLLALSSLARYEPANWARAIDVDSSPYAVAIEHVLDQAIAVIPVTLRYILLHIQNPG